jgi:hypothetical protein
MGRLGIYDRLPMVCEEETRGEVAAHHSGQAATSPLRVKKEVARSGRGGCRCKSDCRSHLFTGFPITHHGQSAIDTKSAHGVQRHEVLGKRYEVKRGAKPGKEVAGIHRG